MPSEPIRPQRQLVPRGPPPRWTGCFGDVLVCLEATRRRAGSVPQSRSRAYTMLSRHFPTRNTIPRRTPSRSKPTFSSARCSATFSISVYASSRWAGVVSNRYRTSRRWAVGRATRCSPRPADRAPGRASRLPPSAALSPWGPEAGPLELAAGLRVSGLQAEIVQVRSLDRSQDHLAHPAIVASSTRSVSPIVGCAACSGSPPGRPFSPPSRRCGPGCRDSASCWRRRR
jgi:hypothetical protein